MSLNTRKNSANLTLMNELIFQRDADITHTNTRTHTPPGGRGRGVGGRQLVDGGLLWFWQLRCLFYAICLCKLHLRNFVHSQSIVLPLHMNMTERIHVRLTVCVCVDSYLCLYVSVGEIMLHAVHTIKTAECLFRRFSTTLFVYGVC